MNTKPRYFVDGWGKDWYVVSRNNRTVAKCPSKHWARKIAKLLNKDYEREQHYAETEIPVLDD